MSGETDDVVPDMPADEGLDQPELGTLEVEGARLLGNDARARLRSDGFDDDEIDAWANAYYVANADEGDVDGLIAWIAEEQAAGRSPADPTS
jgi:hypothetical protein